MEKKMIAVFCAGMIMGVAGTAGALAWGGSVSASEKNTSEVVLENDKVRVKHAVFFPGDKKPGMHTHEYPHVGVALDGGTLRFLYPDGKTETVELKRGGAGYRDKNVTHEAVNVGSKPVTIIEVEIKQ